MNEHVAFDGMMIRKDRGLQMKHVAELKFKPATDAELKALGDNLPDGYVAGWASTNELDLYCHVVETGAYDKAIAKRGLSGPRGIKLLAQHRMDKPAGVIKVLETRNGNLWIEAQMNMNISYVKDLYEAAKMNGGFSFSVGFSLVKDGYRWVNENKSDEYLSISEADLFEVSVVTLPGNEGAEMVYMKGLEDGETFSTIADLEKALAASGMAKSRNEAHKLVTLIKRNAHLFQLETPVLASTKALDDLTANLERMQRLFS